MKKNSFELKEDRSIYVKYLLRCLIEENRFPPQTDILFYAKKLFYKRLKERYPNQKNLSFTDEKLTEMVKRILNGENEENGIFDERTLTLHSVLYKLKSDGKGKLFIGYHGGSYKQVDSLIPILESIDKKIHKAQIDEIGSKIKPVLGSYAKFQAESDKRNFEINQRRLAKISKPKKDESYNPPNINNTQKITKDKEVEDNLTLGDQLKNFVLNVVIVLIILGFIVFSIYVFLFVPGSIGPGMI